MKKYYLGADKIEYSVCIPVELVPGSFEIYFFLLPGGKRPSKVGRDQIDKFPLPHRRAHFK